MTGRETRALMGFVLVLVGVGVLVLMLLKTIEVTIPLALLDGLLIIGGFLLIDSRIASELADLVKAWRGKDAP